MFILCWSHRLHTRGAAKHRLWRRAWRQTRTAPHVLLVYLISTQLADCCDLRVQYSYTCICVRQRFVYCVCLYCTYTENSYVVVVCTIFIVYSTVWAEVMHFVLVNQTSCICPLSFVANQPTRIRRELFISAYTSRCVRIQKGWGHNAQQTSIVVEYSNIALSCCYVARETDPRML